MNPPLPHSASRREFLRSAGCLTIAFTLGAVPGSPAHTSPLPAPPGDSLPDSLREQPRIDAWLEVLADGRVRVFTGKMELGQGIRTAIAQVAAEELEMDLSQVEVHLAETGRTPHEGYTAGSGSIENSAMSVRYAAAAAREKLLQLAARRWGQEVGRLTVRNGKVHAPDGNRQLTFAQLLKGKQLEEEVRLPVSLKPKDQYRWVGKAIPRQDIEWMVRGQPVYVQDLRFPGMVHARIVRPPAYGARLLAFDEAFISKHAPGVLKTVVNGNFVGLIARDEYQAVQALDVAARHARWSAAPPLLPAEALSESLKTLPAQTKRVKAQGNADALDAPGKGALKATYDKPYHMHGSIGPSCAVALYAQDTLHLWTHSQGVYPLRETLKKMLGLEAERIHITGVPGSGCYGHNGADDVAAEAALLALAYPGTHVRLQWTREDEHAWEPYGSAMRMELEAALDEAGKISHWRYAVWSDVHSTRPGGDPGNLLVARSLAKPFAVASGGYSGGAYRNAEPYYTIPNQQIDAHSVTGPLRVSALRSLGAYGNVFAIESFMDELAHRAGQDPLSFRMAHLQDERALAVLAHLRERTRGEKTAPNEGIGVAFARYKNTAAYCAVAARVAVSPERGTVRVLRLWAAIDAGEVINPDGIKNQTEGGMVQAASWTLKEQVRFDRQGVTSRDWLTYPIFRFSEVPAVEVAIINRPDQPALGAGEAAQGPTAAALVNAVFNASGKRIRSLPVEAHLGESASR
ncbi:MAG: xanthine dehydrogenase family protein molybdopterin-binding subunit [Cytophagales bacterium]|nr:xanthine dehydrogenase family protein molybdopterin-binding subunit [Cytophagales bacterium]